VVRVSVIDSGRVFMSLDMVSGGTGMLYWFCREGVLSHVEYVSVWSSGGRFVKISVARYYCSLGQDVDISFQINNTYIYEIRKLSCIIGLFR